MFNSDFLFYTIMTMTLFCPTMTLTIKNDFVCYTYTTLTMTIISDFSQTAQNSDKGYILKCTTG